MSTPRSNRLHRGLGLFSLACGLLWPGLAGAACVLDDTNAEVCASNPRRVISLAPHLTEQWAYVGGLPRLMAVDEASDYPAPVKTLPRLGQSLLLGAEQVLAAKPDLVLVWKSGMAQATIETLRRAGVPVFVSEPRSVDMVAQGMLRLARLMGRETQGKAQVQQWQAQMQALGVSHQPATAQAPTVFYQVWDKPLMTLGGGHIVSELIRLCGGRNAFDAVGALAFTVNVEAVVSKAPDLILASGPNGTGQRLREFWAAWPALPAVANQRVRALPPDVLVRSGPRLIEGAKALCAEVRSAH